MTDDIPSDLACCSRYYSQIRPAYYFRSGLGSRYLPSLCLNQHNFFRSGSGLEASTSPAFQAGYFFFSRFVLIFQSSSPGSASLIFQVWLGVHGPYLASVKTNLIPKVSWLWFYYSSFSSLVKLWDEVWKRSTAMIDSTFHKKNCKFHSYWPNIQHQITKIVHI